MTPTTRKIIISAMGIALAGVIAYATGRATRPLPAATPTMDAATLALLDWLQVPEAQRGEVLQHDSTFAENLRTLRHTLSTRREEMAAALDDPTSADDSIRAKLEVVIAANAALERRTADYLLTVRHHLNSEQQRKLFGLCAENLRQPTGCPWQQNGSSAGRGPGHGRGMRWGQSRLSQPDPASQPAIPATQPAHSIAP